MATQVDWLGDFGGRGSAKCLNEGGQRKVRVKYPIYEMLNLTEKVCSPKLENTSFLTLKDFSHHPKTKDMNSFLTEVLTALTNKKKKNFCCCFC